VLGTVSGFKESTSPLNREDFAVWLKANHEALVTRAVGWLPRQLGLDEEELSRAIDAIPALIDQAIEWTETKAAEAEDVSRSEERQLVEVPPEDGDAKDQSGVSTETLWEGSSTKPYCLAMHSTDVASFYVFDAVASTRFRPEFQYTPSQGMAAALSQYAPGKAHMDRWARVAIGRLVLAVRDELFEAWSRRSCTWSVMFATTRQPRSAKASERRVPGLPACGTSGELGPAQTWVRPAGFAHPWYEKERLPRRRATASYATRAKLTRHASRPNPMADDNGQGLVPVQSSAASGDEPRAHSPRATPIALNWAHRATASPTRGSCLAPESHTRTRLARSVPRQGRTLVVLGTDFETTSFWSALRWMLP